ncbi:MAG: hypothetical protein WCW52_05715 [Elusimicrobiales bacterium]|jgi:hypothetical protein
MRKTPVLFTLAAVLFAARINAAAEPAFDSLLAQLPDLPAAPSVTPAPVPVAGQLGLPPMNPLGAYYKLSQAIVQRVSQGCFSGNPALTTEWPEKISVINGQPFGLFFIKKYGRAPSLMFSEVAPMGDNIYQVAIPDASLRLMLEEQVGYLKYVERSNRILGLSKGAPYAGYQTADNPLTVSGEVAWIEPLAQYRMPSESQAIAEEVSASGLAGNAAVATEWPAKVYTNSLGEKYGIFFLKTYSDRVPNLPFTGVKKIGTSEYEIEIDVDTLERLLLKRAERLGAGAVGVRNVAAPAAITQQAAQVRPETVAAIRQAPGGYAQWDEHFLRPQAYNPEPASVKIVELEPPALEAPKTAPAAAGPSAMRYYGGKALDQVFSAIGYGLLAYAAWETSKQMDGYSRAGRPGKAVGAGTALVAAVASGVPMAASCSPYAMGGWTYLGCVMTGTMGISVSADNLSGRFASWYLENEKKYQPPIPDKVKDAIKHPIAAIKSRFTALY